MEHFDIPTEYILRYPVHFTSSENKIYYYLYDHEDKNSCIQVFLDYTTQNISSIRYTHNKDLHNETGPAVIIYNPISGNKIKEEYYLHSRLVIEKKYYDDELNNLESEKYFTLSEVHNPNGLICKLYYSTGEIWIEKYGSSNELSEYYHRINAPAVIAYTITGDIQEEYWYLNNKRHRENGPAYIQFTNNRIELLEQWYINDKLHRIDGPAYIEYYNGNITSECWYYNNYLHNEKGPAMIFYDNTGDVINTKWFYNSAELTKSIIKNKYPHMYPYFITFYQKELPEEYEAYLKSTVYNIFV